MLMSLHRNWEKML